jgi:hypothetical protein
MQMQKSDRDMMIEWLMVCQGCTRDYWDHMTDELILLNYRENVLCDPSEVNA